jgi:plastocyanin
MIPFARSLFPRRFGLNQFALAIALCLGLPVLSLGQQVSSIGISPNPVAGGSKSIGTVTLTKAAAAGGLKITLSSNQPTVATVPSSVTVPSGGKSATFSIVALPVPHTAQSVITAEDPSNKSVTGRITVDPPALKLNSITISPNPVTAANAANCTVTLSERVTATNGFLIKLASNKSFLQVPASVVIPSGHSIAVFPVATEPVATAGLATVSAVDPEGYAATAAVTVDVPAVRLIGLKISPSPAFPSSTATGTVTLSTKAATGGLKIFLSTMESFIQLPMTVTVPKGESTATFSINVGSLSTPSTASIVAADPNGYMAGANLAVTILVNVQMTNGTQFSPKSVNAAAGQVVVWTNVSDMGHTVNGDLASTNLNIGYVAATGTATWTVPANAPHGAKYYYHCSFHGSPGNGSSFGIGMVGVIIVP